MKEPLTPGEFLALVVCVYAGLALLVGVPLVVLKLTGVIE